MLITTLWWMLLSFVGEILLCPIVHHLFITSDHDLFYVLWVVTLVLEDMGEVLLLVVIWYWSNMCCLIFKLWCYSSSGVMWVELIRLHLSKDLGECIVYKGCLWWVAGVTETWTPVHILFHEGIMGPISYWYYLVFVDACKVFNHKSALVLV